jgi:2',3'-cyclic-nucleotide 2'-phosphodiesterase/3'-nucleotidase
LFAVLATLQSPAATLTLLQTSDLHGTICNWDYARDRPTPHGLATVATIVRREREVDPDLLLLDAGDTIQGSPLVYAHTTAAGADEPHPMALVMRAMRYDAMAVGNHDFNFGLAVLDRFVGQARFPVLAANVRRADGTPRFVPHVIRNVKQVRVAILGLTTLGIPTWEKPENRQGLRFDSAIETARALAPILKPKQADILVALVHAGPHLRPPDPASPDAWASDRSSWVSDGSSPEWNFALRLAEEAPGIDVICSGHTHLAIPDLRVNGVLIVQPGCSGRTVSKVTIETGPDGAATAKKGVVLSGADIEPDAEVLSLARPYHDRALALVRTRIGEAVADFPGGAIARRADGPLADFVNAVQMEMARDGGCPADVSATAIFGDSARFAAGPITVADAYSLYPYENELYVLELRGRELREAMEWSARYWTLDAGAPGAGPAPAPGAKGYHWDVYSGIDYEIDAARPHGQRVVALKFRGEPVQSDQVLRVALNSFRAGGGGGYAMFRNAKILWKSEDQIREALIEHIRRKGAIAPADYHVRNWRLLPDTSRPFASVAEPRP